MKRFYQLFSQEYSTLIHAAVIFNKITAVAKRDAQSFKRKFELSDEERYKIIIIDSVFLCADFSMDAHKLTVHFAAISLRICRQVRSIQIKVNIARRLVQAKILQARIEVFSLGCSSTNT